MLYSIILITNCNIFLLIFLLFYFCKNKNVQQNNYQSIELSDLNPPIERIISNFL